MCGALLENGQIRRIRFCKLGAKAMPNHLNTNGRDETPRQPDSVLLGTAVAYKLLKN
jgi:hypothetical protein